MGRKQKSTSISSKTTPEQNKAILILIDNLKQHEALKITKIKEEYLQTGFKGFLHKKITKNMIPKGDNWAWNQSNARIIYPLSPTVTVTLFKLNPRRLTEPGSTTVKATKKTKRNKKLHKDEDFDLDEDEDDELLSTTSKKRRLAKDDEDEDDIDAKPSYKLWIYQLNYYDQNNANNGTSDPNSMTDQSNDKKGKKKKSSNSSAGASIAGSTNVDIKDIMGDRYGTLHSDNFIVSFIWCEKGRNPPHSSPSTTCVNLPPENIDFNDGNFSKRKRKIGKVIYRGENENYRSENGLNYRGEDGNFCDDDKSKSGFMIMGSSPVSSPSSSSPSPPSSPLYPLHLKNNINNNNNNNATHINPLLHHHHHHSKNNFPHQNNLIEKEKQMMNNIHLNNLPAHLYNNANLSSFNPSLNNLTSSPTLPYTTSTPPSNNNNNNKTNSYALPYLHHVNQKMNINITNINNSPLDPYNNSLDFNYNDNNLNNNNNNNYYFLNDEKNKAYYQNAQQNDSKNAAYFSQNFPGNAHNNNNNMNNTFNNFLTPHFPHPISFYENSQFNNNYLNYNELCDIMDKNADFSKNNNYHNNLNLEEYPNLPVNSVTNNNHYPNSSLGLLPDLPFEELFDTY